MQIGRHRTSRAGNLMRMWFVGAIGRDDLIGMRRVMSEMLAEGAGCYLLGDMQACTGIEAGARKYMTEWSKTGGDMVSGTAVYGVSFAVRTIVTLTLSAIKFLGLEQGVVVMVKDEAEGLRWISAHQGR
jgi:hypothetical protein